MICIRYLYLRDRGANNTRSMANIAKSNIKDDESCSPGFTEDDFDRKTGYLKVDAILRKLMNPIRNEQFYHNPSSMDQLHFEINPKFHVKKQDYTASSLITKYKAVSCGTSSYAFKMFVTTNAHNLITLFSGFVHMGLGQKASLLSPEFADQFRARIADQQVVPTLSVPDNYKKQFSCSVTITDRDVDNLNHTNNASYFRFCIYCGRMAADNGTFSGLTKDVVLYPLLEVDSRFFLETMLGARLTVKTWEDKDSLDTLHFVIQNEPEMNFYAKFKFQV